MYSQMDFIARYKRMKGFNLFYPFGTDDNGLATERLIEKEKKVRSKSMPREEFVELCLNTLKEIRLVYEDQVDDSWERAWYEFAGEWGEVELDDGRREADAAEVLCRALNALVFATAEQLRDWSGWPMRRVTRLMEALEAEGAVRPVEAEGLGPGWMADEKIPSAEPGASVFVLHKQDFLVRAHQSELRRRFGSRDLLQYLLIDGELSGAVRGHWGFAPYDVDDVSVELSARECTRRRDEILTAVRSQYPPPRHTIQRYAGRDT